MLKACPVLLNVTERAKLCQADKMLRTCNFRETSRPENPNSLAAVTFHRCFSDSALREFSGRPEDTLRSSYQAIETMELAVRAQSEIFEAEVGGGSFALTLATMVFESLLGYPRALASDRPGSGSSALALDGRPGDVYCEEAFQHFLSVERTRARRSDGSYLLVLVSLRKCPKNGVEFPRAVFSSLLSGLGLCVREVDFIGWYRQGRIAGAVLAQGLDVPDADAPRRIVDRVTKTLSDRLPRSVVDRLRVRVMRLTPKGIS